MRPLTTLDRRALLKALSLAPVHAVRVPPAVEAEVREAGLISSQVCLLQAAEGEASHIPALLREDLAEGMPGLPMELRLQVVTDDGVPLPGARVDVWQQADGRDLSGRLVADPMGQVNFRTVFPGACASEAAVIHLRVSLMSGEVAETTLAFDPVLSREIHETHDGYRAMTAQTALQPATSLTPITPHMTAPDGEMEVALVVGVTRQGNESGLIDRILRRA